MRSVCENRIMSKSALRPHATLVGLALCLATLPDSAIAQDRGHDIVPPELRAKIEQLKREVRAEPTSQENVARRAEVLWPWANAVSLTGQPIPQNLPLLISVRDSIAERGDPEPWIRAVDGWVRELEVKEEIANALGSIRLSHRGPLPARSWQTIEQTWTAGALGMRVGGGIRVGVDGFNDQGPLQATDPAGENYISIRSSRPGARFVPGPGYSGLSLPARVLLSFTLEGESVEPGDTITLTYGDRSGGSRGFLLQSWSIDQLLLPLYLDLEAQGNFFTPAWSSLEISGMAEVVRVRGVAPSVVRPGESFELAVRSEDRYYNRSSGKIPAYEVHVVTAADAPQVYHSAAATNLRTSTRSNRRRGAEAPDANTGSGESNSFAVVPAGDDGLTVIESLRLGEPGVFRLGLRSTDSGLQGLSNPIWVEETPDFRVFWGDTHGHTQYSEGQGSPEHYFRFARDDARLDFVVLSEHDIWTDDREWQVMRENAKSFLDEGRFVPFLGYEWTRATSSGGHHNVFFRHDVAYRVSAQIAPELARLYQALRRAYAEEDVLVVPHAHAPGDWSQSDPAVERLIEITSTHGTFEFFGNRYLERGWQVGFIGSTDNHHGHPGYPDTGTTFHTERNGIAAVLAPAATSNDLFDAMRDIRAYATGGTRILLDARLDGALVGTRLAADARRRIVARASGTAPIEAIDVIKNGEVAYHHPYLQADLTPNGWVQVSFASSSEVLEHKAPRNFRVFEGWLEVEGARLEELRAPVLENTHRESVTRSSRDRDRVDFTLFTRGRANTILLQLSGAHSGSAITVHLEPGRIQGDDTVLPGEDLSLRLVDARQATLVHALSSTGEPNNDTISVQLIDPQGSLDQELEWTDMGPVNEGDYYYVRVTQLDGERAWSSPFWVGGEARSAAP